jgi:hypothetical protein
VCRSVASEWFLPGLCSLNSLEARTYILIHLVEDIAFTCVTPYARVTQSMIEN